jgi:hypothetical protein
MLEVWQAVSGVPDAAVADPLSLQSAEPATD